jgi:CubicO group peptidase (beta-lactamase class C family)
VIVKVTRGEEVVAEQAFGTSMDGVPATTDMHFRNGAVAFAYIGTLLMQFVDERKVTLDDTIERWMPTLPEAGKVTLKMLANQTSGYPDYETDPAWLAAFNADPFRVWTLEERLRYAFSRPMQFPPGTNWSYSHTNFMVLGEILAKIGGKPLATLLREKVLDPMGSPTPSRRRRPRSRAPPCTPTAPSVASRSGSRRRAPSTRSRRSGTRSGGHRSERTRRRPSTTWSRPRSRWAAVRSCRRPAMRP